MRIYQVECPMKCSKIQGLHTSVVVSVLWLGDIFIVHCQTTSTKAFALWASDISQLQA